MIGLMGVENDGQTIVTPSGRRLFAVPWGLAWKLQAIQHWIAQQSWKTSAGSGE